MNFKIIMPAERSQTQRTQLYGSIDVEFSKTRFTIKGNSPMVAMWGSSQREGGITWGHEELGDGGDILHLNCGLDFTG